MDREEFSRRLNSVIVPEGTMKQDIDSMVAPISEAITKMMPVRLFRCRRCDLDSIIAFKNDTIYTVTADRFNDPYDTLVRYDLDALEEGVNRVMSRESLEQIRIWVAQGNDFPEGVKQVLPEELMDAYREKLLSLDDLTEYEPRIEEARRAMISMMKALFPVLAEESKRYCRIACFSESVNSVLMWSHYADSHRGFVLEYDFRPTLEKPLKNVLIAPVVYDEDRLDVSSYIAWGFLHLLGVNSKNPDITSHIKTVLHKSMEWSYEKEWRLVDYTLRDATDKGVSSISYKPTAIYYGARMDSEKKSLLHDIAKEKGIREYEMFLDYTSQAYEMQYRLIGDVADVEGH